MRISTSVVMATYNGARFVLEQLASIVNQSIPPDEIIVSDDASGDHTPDLIRAFTRNSKVTIKIIENSERLGYSRNFISAINHASGDVIFLSDQDDIWRSDKIEVMLDAFENSEFLLLTHDMSVIDNDVAKIVINSYFSGLTRNNLPLDSNVKGCSLAFKRQLISRFGWPTDQNWTYDKWICLMSSTFGWRGFVHETLVSYRLHDSNVSGWLYKERSDLERFIRHLSVPIFGSRAEMNVMVGSCVDAAIIQDFRKQIGKYSCLSPDRAKAALVAVERKIQVITFQQSTVYKNSIPRRLICTIKLFLGGAYKSSGDLSGFLADIFGKRPCGGAVSGDRIR
jgi:glycosyltransferase involved in cell wall biosynthesis